MEDEDDELMDEVAVALLGSTVALLLGLNERVVLALDCAIDGD